MFHLPQKKGSNFNEYSCFTFASLFCCAGPIPEALGALTTLAQLFLAGNRLTGDFCLNSSVRLAWASTVELGLAYRRLGF